MVLNKVSCASKSKNINLESHSERESYTYLKKCLSMSLGLSKVTFATPLLQKDKDKCHTPNGDPRKLNRDYTYSTQPQSVLKAL